MSSPETLSFNCPHCSVRLTVPARLAGITGPCPSCRKSITAPRPEPLPAPIAARPRVAASAPASVTPVPSPEPESSPPTRLTAVEEPILVEVTPILPPENTRVRPDPRGMRDREPASAASVRHRTLDTQARRVDASNVVRRKGSGRSLRRAATGAFCAAAGIIIYLLCYFFSPSGPDEKIKQASAPLETVTPAVERPLEKPLLPSPPVPSLAASRSSNEETPPVQKTDLEDSPAIHAGNVLDAFLSARDAASRVGLVEPPATEEEMNGTLLKDSLPEVARILPDLSQHNSVEQSTDFPYRVSFFLQNGRNVDFMVLVRQRGTQSPKIFLPAFLDLAGGRLAAFAKEPHKGDPGTFHVILDPLSVCHDETVPSADRKITFKLLPSMSGKETARAYVSSGSRFAKMAEDPNSALRWGVRMRATVTIQWNHKEDPARPYLELMDINSLSWGS